MVVATVWWALGGQAAALVACGLVAVGRSRRVSGVVVGPRLGWLVGWLCEKQLLWLLS
jgi:hypothetical protein